MNLSAVGTGGNESACITGVGAHCAAGGIEQVWRTLKADTTTVGLNVLAGAEGFGAIPSAPVRDVDPGEFLKDRKLLKYMSVTTKLAVSAAGRAVQDAGLKDNPAACEDMALFVATGLTAFDVPSVSRAIVASKGKDAKIDLRKLGSVGLGMCSPMMPFQTLLNMPLGMVSIALGIRGENAIYYPGVDQAGVCFDTVLRGLQHRRFRAALVGATVQANSIMPLCTLAGEGRLASDLCEGRAGYAPADTAAFVVLESRESATERGARVIAHLVNDDGCAADFLVLGGACSRFADHPRTAPEVVVDRAQYPRLAHLDRLFGYQGVAGLPFGITVAATAVERQTLPTGSLSPDHLASLSRVAVRAYDANGSMASALVVAGEGQS